MSEKVLLHLIISPLLEDAVIDLFLEDEGITGFTSFPVNGHGVSHHSLSSSEKVSGYKRQILFQTYLSQQEADLVIKKLKSNFKGSGMHYWTVPMLGFGRID